MRRQVVEEEEEDSDEEEVEKKDEEQKEEEIQNYINPDLTDEERQAEFIEQMKQRFVDGLDPDFGMNLFRFFINSILFACY